MSVRHLIRPIDELRSRDLDLNFLWAFADEFEGLPGQDETSVFPVSADLIPLKGFYGFAAADFIGPEGMLFTGLVQVDTSRTQQLRPAAIVTDKKYAPLPILGHKLADSLLRFAESQLGLPKSTFIPLQYRLRIRFEGEADLRHGVFMLDEKHES